MRHTGVTRSECRRADNIDATSWWRRRMERRVFRQIGLSPAIGGILIYFGEISIFSFHSKLYRR